MNYTAQPNGTLHGVLSPMIYQVYDANYANAGFYYEYKVYVWSGSTTIPASPIATIQKFPDQFASNRAYINTSRLVQQYIANDFLVHETNSPTIGNGAVYTAVKAQAIWDGGSSSVVTSTVMLCTKGYTFTVEGFNNAPWHQGMLSPKTEFLLNPSADCDYVWYDARTVTSVKLGPTYTITPVAVTGSSNAIQGLNLKYHLTAAGLWGTNTYITVTNSGTPHVYEITFDCTSIYGNLTVLYRNRYGVPEAVQMNALNQSAINLSRESMKPAVFNSDTLSSAWSYGVTANQQYNTDSTVTFTCNTGWIPDALNATFSELFLSDRLWVHHAGVFQSAMVTDSAYQRKFREYDKLINYTINISLAQGLVNRIVR